MGLLLQGFNLDLCAAFARAEIVHLCKGFSKDLHEGWLNVFHHKGFEKFQKAHLFSRAESLR